jgi:hypothetical protein
MFPVVLSTEGTSKTIVLQAEKPSTEQLIQLLAMKPTQPLLSTCVSLLKASSTLTVDRLISINIAGPDFDQLLLHAYNQSSVDIQNGLFASFDCNNLSMVNLVTILVLQKIKTGESMEDIVSKVLDRFFEQIKVDAVQPPVLYLLLFISNLSTQFIPRMVAALKETTNSINQAYLIQMIDYACRYQEVPRYIAARLKDSLAHKPSKQTSTVVVGNDAYIDLIEVENPVFRQAEGVESVLTDIVVKISQSTNDDYLIVTAKRFWNQIKPSENTMDAIMRCVDDEKGVPSLKPEVSVFQVKLTI